MQLDTLYRLAYTYTNNEHDAMDALKNMIDIVYEKIKQLKNPQAFYTWSKFILVNECRTLLQKQKRIVFLEGENSIKDPFDPIQSLHELIEKKDYLQTLSAVQPMLHQIESDDFLLYCE